MRRIAFFDRGSFISFARRRAPLARLRQCWGSSMEDGIINCTRMNRFAAEGGKSFSGFTQRACFDCALQRTGCAALAPIERQSARIAPVRQQRRVSSSSILVVRRASCSYIRLPTANCRRPRATAGAHHRALPLRRACCSSGRLTATSRGAWRSPFAARREIRCRSTMI
jgi:hypothetical protein